MFVLSRIPTKEIAGFVLVLGFVMLLGLTLLQPVSAQTAPLLGTAASFAVLGSSAVTNTGPSVVNGNLGVSPSNSVTGFPPGTVVIPSTIHAADAAALQARNDATTAYNTLAGESCTANLTGQDLGGMTLTSGVYCFDSSAQLTGALTLNAGGSAGSVFIFKMNSTLTTASGSSVVVTNSNNNCNVWWQVGSSATIGTTTQFAGNILAQASITLTTGASVSGRALALTGAVTLDNNTVGSPACITPVAIPTETPTSTLTFTPTLTPTLTFTPTFTATLTFTPTFTATITPGGPTLTPTPTFTPTNTFTATITPGGPTLTPSATLTSQPTSVPQATAVLISSTQPSPAQPVSGLPNAGGGPPQATYWTREPRR